MFQKQSVSLGPANPTTGNIGVFTDVPGLSLQFSVLEDEQLVEFGFDGLVALDAADRLDLQFAFRKESEVGAEVTAAAFAAPAGTGAQGVQSLHVNAALANLRLNVSPRQEVKLAKGKYTVRLQYKNAGAGIATFNGLVANGKPGELFVQRSSNDAFVSLAQNHKSIHGNS